MARRRHASGALLACAAACLSLVLTASGAKAVTGEGFGFAAVNVPGAPSAPAFPSQQAIWAGGCDLTSASTAVGGVGAPPAIRAHCIDPGALSPLGDSPWVGGSEPSWRLDPVTQAAAHPDATVSFFFSRVAGNSGAAPAADVRDIIVRLPRGVVGSPSAVPLCPAAQAQFVPPACPPSTQLGISTLDVAINSNNIDRRSFPVYNIEARDTVTAEFSIGAVHGLFNVPVTARGRTNGDYGVDTLALLIPAYAPLGSNTITLWGVPWAEEHDRFRVDPSTFLLNFFDWIEHTTGVPPEDQRPYQPDWGPIKPFFVNPTECSGAPLDLVMEASSWQKPSEFVTGVSTADPITGCEKLEFDPQITLRPTVDVADSPAGVDVKLTIPQNDEPPAEALGNPNLPFDPNDSNGAPAYWRTDAGLARAHLKDTTVKLPAGTSFNPAAANGLEGCTTDQVGLTATSPNVTFDNEKVTCPDSSKIGTLEIVTPLLPDPLFGDVYAAPQHDNPFPGSLTAIYMVAQDEERGLSVKLPGKVDLDPATGQIATTFVDNPQLPFETFELHFKTGPRAPLNTPPTCGQFSNAVDLTPWSFPDSGPIAQIADPFPISRMPNGLGCVTEPEDRVFAPGFEAGSTSTQAGAHTSFVLNVTRRDGEQELSGIDLQMPEGLTAKLAGVPYCPDAALAAIHGSRSGRDEAAASLCPAASQLGDVHTLAGAGPLPLPTSGRLYLAGPFQGAPVSIAAIVPAIAGGTPGNPAFDLGNVVVRSAAHVDPKTARVSVDSTKLPHIVGGVPLRVRRVSVNITKPGFMLNPTDCSEQSIGASLGGAADPLVAGDDSSASRSSRFQVGGCESLRFKPKLKLRLFGKTRRGAYQRLRAVLTARPGDANIARASVRMPRSAFLAQEHIRTVCTRVQFAAEQCPKGSVYGRATAWSPLLDAPLTGPVYLRSSDNLLPDLVVALKGPAHQPVEVELSGRTDSVKKALRNTFDVVPDAPVSRFRLDLFGGKKGLIVNSEYLCRKAQRATVRMTAQNGRRLTMRPKVKNACKNRKARKRARGKRR